MTSSGLIAGRAEVVPDRRTRIGLQTRRFLPWRLIARTVGPLRRSAVSGMRP